MDRMRYSNGRDNLKTLSNKKYLHINTLLARWENSNVNFKRKMFILAKQNIEKNERFQAINLRPVVVLKATSFDAHQIHTCGLNISELGPDNVLKVYKPYGNAKSLML